MFSKCGLSSRTFSANFYKKWFGKNDPDVIKELQGPALNITSPQSEIAPAILKIVKDVLRSDKNYLKRLKSHYKLFKEIVESKENKSRNFSYRNYLSDKPINTKSQKIGRNEPCPCGSGKKYKNCCLGGGEIKKS